MNTTVEKDIVAFLKNGNKKAISLLYENYSGALLGVIKKVITDDDLAQDVLQESFVKVWKKGKTYNPEKAKLFTWLYRIAYNTAIDKIRSVTNKTNKEIQIEASNVYKLTTDSLNEDTLDIKRHIGSLDLKYQTVINALYFEGMTQQEASDELEIPLGTIKSRLKIGLRELKKNLPSLIISIMNVDITTFLNSDLLENYLIGQTTPEETLKVEDYIKKYPEVKAAYNTMQNQLELVAQTNAEEAPLHLLGSILESIDDKPVVALNTVPSKKSWYKFGVAASVAALLFASASFYFFNLNQKLTNENQIVVDELFDLRNDIDKNNSKLEALMEQFAQLNNPETEKYIIKGNKRAKNLKTVAYINPKEKTSMIDVVALPTLPKEKCYQIWAEMQDRMVSLGILSETDRRLQKIPYTEDALGLTITIEPKGGSENISGDTPVAEIELKIND